MNPETMLSAQFGLQHKDEYILLLRNYGMLESMQDSARRYYTPPPCPTVQSGNAGFILLMHEYLFHFFQAAAPKDENNALNNDLPALNSVFGCLIAHAHGHSQISAAIFKDILFDAMLCCGKQPNDAVSRIALICFMTQIKLISSGDYEKHLSSKKLDLKKFHLIWNSRCEDDKKLINCTMFANDVCTYLKNVCSPNGIIALFDPISQLKPVVVPHNDLCAFLVLFDLLYKCKRIGCSPNRGLLSFLSKHIVAPNKESSYTVINLRMKKSREMNISKQKENIKDKIKFLFFKYCPDKNSANLFETYFR